MPDVDNDELLEQWRESDRRSRERRAAPPKRHRVRALLVCLAVAAAGYGVGNLESERGVVPETGTAAARPVPELPPGAQRATPASPAVPGPRAMRGAWRYARKRGGMVSFAVVDTAGRLRGRDGRRRYPCASVGKAMLLVAELRRLRRERVELDPYSKTVLTTMITHSDNDAADTIFLRVGNPGLLGVARAAGMRRFEPGPDWANAQLTAADLARFFSRLPRLLPREHRRAALRMLASIVREQRWGVPRAAGPRWRVRFKGGWRETGRGELVHQGARLTGDGRALSIAVMTDGQRSRTYAIHTVRGIAERLLP